MNAVTKLWKKFAKSKRYREEFVAAQVKRGIPFQIRKIMKQKGLSQQEVASRAGLTQGVVSRAADPEYGNLTLNTIIRIAAGLDVAFIGKFVPFSDLGYWFLNLSEEPEVKTFDEENEEIEGQQAVGLEQIIDDFENGGLERVALGQRGELIPFDSIAQRLPQGLAKKQPEKETHYSGPTSQLGSAVPTGLQ